jgi:hypothetical protein
LTAEQLSSENQPLRMSNSVVLVASPFLSLVRPALGLNNELSAHAPIWA